MWLSTTPDTMGIFKTFTAGVYWLNPNSQLIIPPLATCDNFSIGQLDPNLNLRQQPPHNCAGLVCPFHPLWHITHPMISPIYTVNNSSRSYLSLFFSFWPVSLNFWIYTSCSSVLVLLILFIPIPLSIATHILLFFYQLCNELAQNIYGSVNTTGEIPFNTEE